MDNTQFLIYLIIMAGTTYLIRAIPFALVKEKITNKFVQSFLYYIPYAVLTAMTIPGVFYCTAHPISALAGVIVAVVFALKKQSLTVVAVAACVAVFVAEFFV